MENHTLEHLYEDAGLRDIDHEEINNSQALVIRHAQSQANAGLRTPNINEVYLTEVGHKQAKHLADFLPNVMPSAIIHSPYIRTRMTADPAINRYLFSEVLEWPIQEFTYLDPSKYNGTTNVERREIAGKYWEALDPEYRDGGVSESFVDLWKRVENFRESLDKIVPGALVFAHSQFMRMMWLQQLADKPNREAMAHFHDLNKTFEIANTSRIAVLSTGELSAPKSSHLPADLITY